MAICRFKQVTQIPVKPLRPLQVPAAFGGLCVSPSPRSRDSAEACKPAPTCVGCRGQVKPPLGALVFDFHWYCCHIKGDETLWILGHPGAVVGSGRVTGSFWVSWCSWRNAWRRPCEFFQLQPETSRQVCLSHLKCEHKPDTRIYCECSSRIKFIRQESAFNL